MRRANNSRFLFWYIRATNISVGVPAAFAELALHTGFVIHKAKVENLAKFNKLNDASINMEV